MVDLTKAPTDTMSAEYRAYAKLDAGELRRIHITARNYRFAAITHKTGI